MKKLFLALLLCISTASFSQIKLIKTTKTEVLSRIGLVYIEQVDEGKSFIVNYSNMNAPIIEYKKFKFNNTDNAFNTLYQIIMQGFEEVPRDPYKLQAGEDIIYLKYTKIDGNVLMQIQQFVESDNIESENVDDDNKEMAVSKHLTQDDIKLLFKK